MADARDALRRTWWPAALVLAACACVLGRPGEARSEPDGARVAYVCLGDLAVDLTGGAADPSATEGKLAIASEEARAGCLLPRVPFVRGARVLVSARTRDAKWGLAAEEVGLEASEALRRKREALAASGWRETGASSLLSRQAPGTALAVFERGGAWVFVVAAPLDGGERSAIVAAGRILPGRDWRQP